jgi:thermitase
MYRYYISLIVTLSIIVLVGSGLSAEQALSEPELDGPQPDSSEATFAPGQILVKVEDNAPADALASLNRRNHASTKEKIPDTRVSVVDLPDDLSVTQAVGRYEASPSVEYAEPDYLLYPQVTPNDPDYSRMYNLDNRGQYDGTFDADIDAPQAWNRTKGSAETAVAIIDTGIDIRHPDLNDNIWTNPDEVPGNDEDDDRNGYVDDVHGWDFVNEDASVFDGPGDGHGTHVAGTIAAEGNNGVGVTGINWQIEIMPLKFLGAGGRVSDAVEALNYAIAEGAKISNNSYGYYDNCGGCYAQTLRDAIERADKAGHLFVAAAGNGGGDYTGDDNGVNPFYPASYDSPNIISVAATNQKDTLASFSNYGSASVDLGAPGTSILSTFPDNSYGYGEGTSMATPHVAGAAALVMSRYPLLGDEAIKDLILRSVEKKSALRGKVASGGRLSVAKALGVNTPPVIRRVRPRSKIGDRTPIIRATIRDNETDLIKENIRLYLNGNRKRTFRYARSEDELSYASGKRSYGRHTVRISVRDERGLEETRVWRFRIVRHR